MVSQQPSLIYSDSDGDGDSYGDSDGESDGVATLVMVWDLVVDLTVMLWVMAPWGLVTVQVYTPSSSSRLSCNKLEQDFSFFSNSFIMAKF